MVYPEIGDVDEISPHIAIIFEEPIEYIYL